MIVRRLLSLPVVSVKILHTCNYGAYVLSSSYLSIFLSNFDPVCLFIITCSLFFPRLTDGTIPTAV